MKFKYFHYFYFNFPLGLFDQYLHCKTKDPYMESITKGQDWLCFSDLIQQRVLHDQDFMLRKYSIFLPVAFHMLFAKATPLKLQYTNASYEVGFCLSFFPFFFFFFFFFFVFFFFYVFLFFKKFKKKKFFCVF